jgi:hypothetical protein
LIRYRDRGLVLDLPADFVGLSFLASQNLVSKTLPMNSSKQRPRPFLRTLSILTVTSGAVSDIPFIRRRINGALIAENRFSQYGLISRYSIRLRRAMISAKNSRCIVVVSLSIVHPRRQNEYPGSQ